MVWGRGCKAFDVSDPSLVRLCCPLAEVSFIASEDWLESGEDGVAGIWEVLGELVFDRDNATEDTISACSLCMSKPFSCDEFDELADLSSVLASDPRRKAAARSALRVVGERPCCREVSESSDAVRLMAEDAALGGGAMGGTLTPLCCATVPCYTTR